MQYLKTFSPVMHLVLLIRFLNQTSLGRTCGPVSQEEQRNSCLPLGFYDLHGHVHPCGLHLAVHEGGCGQPAEPPSPCLHTHSTGTRETELGRETQLTFKQVHLKTETSVFLRDS